MVVFILKSGEPLVWDMEVAQIKLTKDAKKNLTRIELENENGFVLASFDRDQIRGYYCTLKSPRGTDIAYYEDKQAN